MKQLFWKEWHELRFLPLGAALLYFLLVFGYYLLCVLHIAGQSINEFSQGALLFTLYLLWPLFAIFDGAGLISQEVGTGTLSFLLALPGSRSRVWLVKVLVGFGILVACVVASALVCWAFYGLTTSSMPNQPNGNIDLLSNSADAFLVAVGCFCVSLAVSPLLDRYISAAMVSLVTCIVLASLITTTNSAYSGYQDEGDVSAYLDFVCVWLAIPVLIATSYWTFTRGESLRSAKRFYVAGRVLGIGAIIFCAIFFSLRSYAMARTEQAQSLARRNTAAASVPTARLPGQAIGRLYINEKVMGDGQPEWEVILPPQIGTVMLKDQLLVDGRTTFSGETILPSLGTSGWAAPPRTLDFSASVDNNMDTMVKAVLAAQNVAVLHPNDVTFNVRAQEGEGSTESPITLRFKTGYAMMSGAPVPNDQAFALGQPVTVMDEFLADKSVAQISSDWQKLPNDPSFEAHFAPDTVHRITVQFSLTQVP